MTVLYAITVSLMIVVPLLLAIALRRRFRAPWLLWTAGALSFFLSQVYHLPLNNLLGDLGLIGPIAPDAPGLLPTAVVLGLSAGLCEGLMRLVAFWWLNRRGLVDRWPAAVMVGLALLVFSTYDMFLRAFRPEYKGPMEAIVAVFDIGVGYLRAMAAWDVIAVLVGGGVLAGLLSEWAARRWK